MNVKDSIRSSLRISDFLSQGYLADITPEEMFVQPVADANHIAWQLGHLIASERHLVEAASPGSMPALPEGFAERHRRDAAPSTNPADYLTKDEYLQLAKQVRTATLRALDRFNDADFDKPVTARAAVRHVRRRLLRHDRPPLVPPCRPVGRSPPQARPCAYVLTVLCEDLGNHTLGRRARGRARVVDWRRHPH
jgi:hypothetical protein